MKKKLSMNLFLFLLKLVSIINKCFSRFIKKDYDLILCYHDIGSNDWEFSVSVQEFEKHITCLKTIGEIVDLKTIISKRGTKGVRIAITFDDGYEGVFNNAFPVLKKYGAKAAVFLVGKRDISHNTGYKSDLLKTEQIKMLDQHKWNMGFHTLSHIDVTRHSHQDLIAEISDGKKLLEQKLGIKLKYFAYPFGRFNPQSVRVVRKSGFSAAFTVDGGKSSDELGRFKFDRITVTKHIGQNDLTALVSPPGIWVNKLFTKLWKVKDNLKN